MTGSGTAADPYLIYNVTDLQAIENDLTAYYELANDIDASATVGWNGGLGFAPLGYPIDGFTGSLDGKGYKVDGLFMNRSTPFTRCVAFIDFFGYVGPKVVKNLALTNVNITAISGPCAGFIGLNSTGTITNCYVTGSVTGNSRAAGFVRQNMGVGTIEDCYSECTVVTTGGSAGGFVEYNTGTIKRCYATGDVTASHAVGGFARESTFSGVIQDCYCRGNVTSSGNNTAGGFIDHHRPDAIIDNCYSTGTLTTTGTKGGFCRLWWHPSTITDCFWDTDSSGEAVSDGGTGKTTAEMKSKGTFACWNFKTIWNMLATVNDGYACLCNVTGGCPLTRIKGNPHIDQLIYQHVERIDR